MRIIDPQLETLLAMPNKIAALLGYIEWSSGVARFHNGVSQVVWDGETYYGVGEMGDISGIKEGAGSDITLTLQTHDVNLIEEAIKDDSSGGNIRLYLAAFDENMQVAAAQLIYAGLVNFTPVSYGDVPKIAVEGISYNHRWNMPKEHTTYTAAYQRSLHSTDSFFDDVESVTKGPLSSYQSNQAVGRGSRARGHRR